ERTAVGVPADQQAPLQLLGVDVELADAVVLVPGLRRAKLKVTARQLLAQLNPTVATELRDARFGGDREPLAAPIDAEPGHASKRVIRLALEQSDALGAPGKGVKAGSAETQGHTAMRGKTRYPRPIGEHDARAAAEVV